MTSETIGFNDPPHADVEPQSADAWDEDSRSPEHGLWQAFWTRRDQASRNDLVLAYKSIVEHVVARLPINIRDNWDIGDLKSFGLFGLFEAIDRFEEGSVIHRFRAYGTQRVRGAIYDELRRLDWLPRTVRRRVISYRSTVDDLAHEFRRAPSREEIFSSLNVKPAEGAALLVDVRSAQLLRFEHPSNHDSDGDDVERSHIVGRAEHDRDKGPETQVLAYEQIAELKDAIARLPERQRAVVNLHFLGNMTQGQIGAMLGITSSRVCQIQASAIESLRRILEGEGVSRAG